jgi:hypothetical protein
VTKADLSPIMAGEGEGRRVFDGPPGISLNYKNVSEKGGTRGSGWLGVLEGAHSDVEHPGPRPTDRSAPRGARTCGASEHPGLFTTESGSEVAHKALLFGEYISSIHPLPPLALASLSAELKWVST